MIYDFRITMYDLRTGLTEAIERMMLIFLKYIVILKS